MHRRKAFTLIEVLVVIAVIAALVAILFPVFASARRRAQQVTCLSNLRQLGVATFQYAQDYDDRYPYGGDPSDLDTDSWETFRDGKYWPAIQDMKARNLLMPNVMAAYVKDKQLWHCPADNGFTVGGSFEDIPLDAKNSCFDTYGMSYLYITPLALDGQTISGVRVWSREPPYSEHEPVKIPLFTDHVGRWHGGAGEDDGRINMVMVDGHAITVGSDEAHDLDRIQSTIPDPNVTP